MDKHEYYELQKYNWGGRNQDELDKIPQEEKEKFTKELLEINWPDFEPTQDTMEELLSGIDFAYFLDKDGDIGRIEGARHFDYGLGYAILNGWTLETEEQFGGEGQGDDYWVVVKATKGDRVSYWKFYGYHASHDGTYLENVMEVKPKEVIKIEWS